jgi:uncharacterized protein
MSEGTPAAAPVIEPVSATERIEALDILRGFAVFGILLVNMGAFAAPLEIYTLNAHPWKLPADRIAEYLIQFFAQGKFYSTFSFLFGLGLSVQMARAEARGVRFVRFYSRRLSVLIGIGLVHAFLIWYGDILVTYALIGFVLLLFRNRSPKTLLIWFVVLALLPIVVTGATWVLTETGVMKSDPAGDIAKARVAIGQALRAYGQGSLADIMAQRAKDAAFVLGRMLMYGSLILAWFLAGLYAGRRGVFQDLPGSLPLFRRVFRNSAAPAILGSLAAVVAFESVNPNLPTPAAAGAMLLFVAGAAPLCLCYISGIAILSANETWRARLAPLGKVGRTALSNYLFQSLVCTTLMYSYGLRLYGKVGPAAAVCLAVGIFAFQIPLSDWWLARFRFGPAEWLWRTLTYGKRLRMRVVAE